MYNRRRGEVLDGIRGALDTHKFVFGRLMGLADALGWIAPKADADGPESAEIASNGAVAEKANPADIDTSQSPPPQSPSKSVLFDAVTYLDAQLTMLRAALPPRASFLLFSGHSAPRAMSALTARRSEFQASLNPESESEAEWWNRSCSR